jgi:hypothetical protein
MSPEGDRDPRVLLRLSHLVSPALPVGAYAYSQGLEYAKLSEMVSIVHVGKCGAAISLKKTVVRIPSSARAPHANATSGSRITGSIMS